MPVNNLAFMPFEAADQSRQNFLSNFYRAQENQRAQEVSQRAQRQDMRADNDARFQQATQLAAMIEGVQDGDVQGFERIKQFAGRFMDPQEIAKYGPQDLPALRSLASQLRGKTQQPNDVREYEYAKGQGYGGTFADWQMEQKRAGATNVTVNNAGEKEFEKVTGKSQAEMFANMATEGVNAKADIANVAELETRLAKTPGGVMGGVQDLALSWGIQLGKGATDAQAAKAIIARLVPTQRTPGSGQMSDRDVLLFKDSLPKLLNTKEGNALILRTMKAMAQFKVDQAKIASAAMTGEIGRAEATQMLVNLPDPLAEFKQSSTKAGPGDVRKSKDKNGREIILNPSTGKWEYP